MRAIRVILVWLVLAGCAWGQPIEGGIEKVEDSERLEWIHYEPPPARWMACESQVGKSILKLTIDNKGKGCIVLGDSVGAVEAVTIFLKVKMNRWDVPDSYIIEFDSFDSACKIDAMWWFNWFRIYQPQADRKNVTEKFISRKAKDENIH